MLSCVRLFVTPWTVACQAPLSVGFSRRRRLDWVATSSSRESSNPGTEPQLLSLRHWPADSSPLMPPGKPPKINKYLKKKRSIKLPFDPPIPILSTYLKELKAGTQRAIGIPMFIAAWGRIAKRWLQPKCVLMDGWINKM